MPPSGCSIACDATTGGGCGGTLVTTRRCNAAPASTHHQPPTAEQAAAAMYMRVPDTTVNSNSGRRRPLVSAGGGGTQRWNRYSGGVSSVGWLVIRPPFWCHGDATRRRVHNQPAWQRPRRPRTLALFIGTVARAREGHGTARGTRANAARGVRSGRRPRGVTFVPLSYWHHRHNSHNYDNCCRGAQAVVVAG